MSPPSLFSKWFLDSWVRQSALSLMCLSFSFLILLLNTPISHLHPTYYQSNSLRSNDLSFLYVYFHMLFILSRMISSFSLMSLKLSSWVTSFVKSFLTCTELLPPELPKRDLHIPSLNWISLICNYVPHLQLLNFVNFINFSWK